jgi:purine-binding chemotaxis protein CheW
MREEKVNIEDESIEADKYLTYSIGEERFGLDIKFVDDIIGVQDITKVPNQPDYLQGVINLRGVIIPVIDIRVRFDKPFRTYDDRTCIIVINIEEAAIGIVVDTVLEVINIPDDIIAAPPKFEEDVVTQYIKGIGNLENHVVIIIDCYKLIREE